MDLRINFNSCFISEVYFNPLDATAISIISDGQLRILTLCGTNLKSTELPKLIPKDIVCHVWISPYRYILGTKTGFVFVVDKGEVRAEIRISDFTSKTQNVTGPVNAISPHSEVGFCCLLGNYFVVVLEAIDKAGLSYRKLCEIKLEGSEFGSNYNRYGIAVSPNSASLVVCVDGRFWTANLKNLALVKGGIVTSQEVPVSGHKASVIQVSTCAWKPWVATCSKDGTLSVWNLDNGSLLSQLTFPEDVFSLSFHPFGLYIAVSLDSSLPIVATRVDGLKISLELNVRGSSLVAFSPGGHLLAATQRNVISLISFRTLDVAFVLLGHKGSVSGLAWLTDNRRLVTCGTGGSANIWDSTTGELISQVRVRHTSLQAIDHVSADLLYAISGEGSLLEIYSGKVSEPFTLPEASIESAVGISECQKLIIGSSTGSIKICTTPLGPENQIGAVVDTRVHLQAVITMCISADSSMIITGCKDGSIAFWKIQPKSSHVAADSGKGLSEHLVRKSDWDEKEESLERALRKVAEIRLESEFEVKKRKQEIEKEILVLKANYEEKLSEKEHISKVLNNELEELKKESKSKLEKMTNIFQKELAKTVELYETRLVVGYEREKEAKDNVEALTNTLEKERKAFETTLESIKQMHLVESKALQSEHEATLKQELQLTINAMVNHSVTERTDEIKENEDFRSTSKRTDYNCLAKRDEDSHMTLRLRAEAGYLKKKLESMQQQLDDRNKQISRNNGEISRLEYIINTCETEISSLKQDIKENEKKICEKNSLIHELYLQEAIKGERILSLEQSIGDAEKSLKEGKMELNKLHEQFTKMKMTCLNYKKEKRVDLEKIKNAERKCHQSLNELRLKNDAIQQLKRHIQNMEEDFDIICENINDLRTLQSIVKEIRISKNDNTGKKKQEKFTSMESGSYSDTQRTERVLSTMRNTLKQERAKFESEKKKLLQENITLLSTLQKKEESK
ncbi:hypothetical protein QYM36_000963 [Artemia franciscana]|uniref:Uncharacterized protein n=2 Tax=Artemia franciscana TaxID=6661 RepID=A0AA88IM51_ARTSF|nr:hypothetical protein QYM36_000963 [Artemia franciscana]